jgi:hypothetical protein
VSEEKVNWEKVGLALAILLGFMILIAVLAKKPKLEIPKTEINLEPIMEKLKEVEAKVEECLKELKA